MNTDEIKLGLIRRITNHGYAKRGYLNTTIRTIIDSDLSTENGLSRVIVQVAELQFEDNEVGQQYVHWLTTQLIVNKF